MTKGQLRFVLEIDSIGDPIEGRIHDGHHRTIAFTGWLELIAALERLTSKRSNDRPNSATESGHPEPGTH